MKEEFCPDEPVMSAFGVMNMQGMAILVIKFLMEGCKVWLSFQVGVQNWKDFCLKVNPSKFRFIETLRHTAILNFLPIEQEAKHDQEKTIS